MGGFVWKSLALVRNIISPDVVFVFILNVSACTDLCIRGMFFVSIFPFRSFVPCYSQLLIFTHLIVLSFYCITPGCVFKSKDLELETSYEREYAMSVFLCQEYLIRYALICIHPITCKAHDFNFLYSWIIFHIFTLPVCGRTFIIILWLLWVDQQWAWLASICEVGCQVLWPYVKKWTIWVMCLRIVDLLEGFPYWFPEHLNYLFIRNKFPILPSFLSFLFWCCFWLNYS